MPIEDQWHKFCMEGYVSPEKKLEIIEEPAPRKRTIDDTLLLMRKRAAIKRAEMLDEPVVYFDPESSESEYSDSEDEEIDEYERMHILQNVHRDLMLGQDLSNFRNLLAEIGDKLAQKFVIVDEVTPKFTQDQDSFLSEYSIV